MNERTIVIPYRLFEKMADVVAGSESCCDHEGLHCSGQSDADNSTHRDAAAIWPEIEAVMAEADRAKTAHGITY